MVMRKRSQPLLLAILGAPLLVPSLQPLRAAAAAPPTDHDRYFAVREQETIQRSFTLPAEAHKSLSIDNIFGSIEVAGGATNQVQLEVVKTIRAESNAALERARKEVSLDITEDQGELKLYVNGPFRCHCNDCCGSHEGKGYIVKMDFKVQVPAEIDLEVRTVNEGRVRISGVTGEFLVRNVNGGIEMDSVGGSGSARTVNGPVTVSFRQNPHEKSEFHTINGNVELRFVPGLAADFRFKNFNGGIYSDFPVSALPLREVSQERHDGKLILRADRYSGVRIGAGGPEIEVENLNGDICILENHE
jgi:hypothetical protein